jgi:2-methylcitrate dehydratase PrpD
VSYAHDLVRFGVEAFHSPCWPDRVRNRVRDIIIDQVGLQLACSRYPWCEAVYRYVTQVAGPGQSTILRHGDRTSPEHAAFVNSSFGHGQDYDDTVTMVQTHPGAVIVPVAMAVGEEVGATGRSVLDAAAVGIEVMLRVAHSVSPDCLRRGHHTPPAAGPFGAAITAGLLLGLDSEQLVSALGIAGSFSGGLLEYTQSGGSVKRIHCAIPTTGGIRAAYLAKLGVTGPATVLEGRKGFCRVFADEPRIERLTDGLGERFLIEAVGFKFYNCCLFVHAPLEAFVEIVREHGLSPSEIERVRVGTSRQGVMHVGQLPEPTDEVGAQFSLHFSLPVAVLKEPPGLRTYETCLDDQAIRELASRVSVYEDPVATAEYPSNWGGVVTVETHDGRSFTNRVRFPRGTPENPMTSLDFQRKFFSNAAPELGPDGCSDAYEALLALEENEDIRLVARRLVAEEERELQLAGRRSEGTSDRHMS